jgi:FtsH-binding integral membrane protein
MKHPSFDEDEFFTSKVDAITWLNWGFIALSLLFNPLPMKLAALASVVNYFIFFGPELINTLKIRHLTYKNRKRFRDAFKNNRR